MLLTTHTSAATPLRQLYQHPIPKGNIKICFEKGAKPAFMYDRVSVRRFSSSITCTPAVFRIPCGLMRDLNIKSFGNKASLA